GLGNNVDAVLLESIFQYASRVSILAWQHAVTRGNQGDLCSQQVVGRSELSTGHTGTNDDQVLGHLVHVVDLGPVEDPLAVRLRGRQLTRVGAYGNQHGIGFDLLLGTIWVRNGNRMVIEQPALTDHDAHAGTLKGRSDIRRLFLGKVQQAVVNH